VRELGWVQSPGAFGDGCGGYAVAIEFGFCYIRALVQEVDNMQKPVHVMLALKNCGSCIREAISPLVTYFRT
jgi:hypothetical protein